MILAMKWFVIGLMYVGVFAAVAVGSYISPNYRFNGAGVLTVLSIIGVVAIVMWRRRKLTRLDWLLPVLLILIALASFPNTSRDHLRYLFDGEMIRLMHLSPYVHLPYEFPVDQYSQAFDHIWWTQIPSPYGPLWQALMVAINFVSDNQIVWGVVALKLVNLAGLLVCARYIFLITRKAWISYVFLINPVILINTVATPHSDIVIAAGLMVAVYHQNASVRGVLVGAAGLIKAHSLIFWPFLVKSRRSAIALAGWTSGALVVFLLALKPLVGFEWRPMLQAGQGGGVTGMVSLLMYHLLPGASANHVILASYGLFLVMYGFILGLYVRQRVSSLTGLALASLAVPLCLTGVLLPWHFIIPFACLLICEKPLATAAVLVVTLLCMRSAVTVPELIGLSVLIAAAYLALRWTYGKISDPPELIVRIGGYLKYEHEPQAK